MPMPTRLENQDENARQDRCAVLEIISINPPQAGVMFEQNPHGEGYVWAQRAVLEMQSHLKTG